MTLKYLTPLSPDEQTAFGVDPTVSLAIADRVRFGELDVLGHVNNAVYMQWFENVRVVYTQISGLSRYDNSKAPRIVIRSASIHYKQEMLLNEDYAVTCTCTEFRTTSFTMHQEIWAGGTQRAAFDCVMVLLHPDGSGRYPIPDALRAYFIENDGAKDARGA